MNFKFDIVIIGLTITSSWGNGHATTYRGLMRALSSRGYNVLFLERDMPWYQMNRDLASPPYGCTKLYNSLNDLRENYRSIIEDAELVIIGSYVPEGVEVAEWILRITRGKVAFYDIDTPLTLSCLKNEKCNYLNSDLIPKFHLYLSFAGGPILNFIKDCYGAQIVRPFYCSVDTQNYFPVDVPKKYDLGYMGTYSADRQLTLNKLMIDTALHFPDGKFVIAGPQYPKSISWPSNVNHLDHISPQEHPSFYCSQQFTLNVTREDMIKAGYSPSVRLFEAAACGIPIISDYWDGLDSFFTIGDEILISNHYEDTLKYLKHLSIDERQRIGKQARRRILRAHTSYHRVLELEQYMRELQSSQSTYFTKRIN